MTLRFVHKGTGDAAAMAVRLASLALLAVAELRQQVSLVCRGPLSS